MQNANVGAKVQVQPQRVRLDLRSGTFNYIVMCTAALPKKKKIFT